MVKLRHLQAIPSLLGLELRLAPQAQLVLQAMERLNQESQTKKSAPWRLARKLPPPKQA